jgi:alkylated DNA repair protein (DNA oxidative demethylase)
MDLFDDLPPDVDDSTQRFAPGAVLLRAFARSRVEPLMQALEAVLAQAPLRHMQTPGGHTMTVATSSCGSLGWVSDRHGYRYAAGNPQTGLAWPPMPGCFAELAQHAAQQAGYAHFVPEACLINQYAPGAKLSLHQDRDEKEFTAPIVSVSLGLPAVFQFGGLQRAERAQRLRLAHGDVVVWGGPSRLAFHGVLPLADGQHALLGRRRINLTFRRVNPMA